MNVIAGDTERMKEGCEMASGGGVPGAPWTVIKAGEQREQFAGSEIFRFIFHEEPAANVREQLNRKTAVRDVEDGRNGSAGLFRPRSANEGGNMEERFSARLLIRRETGGQLRGRILRRLAEGDGVTPSPEAEPAGQGSSGGLDGNRV